MKVVCISDTHEQHPFDVPDGDLLIHSGDLTWDGNPVAIKNSIAWLKSLPHQFKVVIAGNHDFEFYEHCGPSSDGFHILNDSGVTIENLKVWGSPITPQFGNWAFMQTRGDEIARTWNKIPYDTDILITHGPPMGILDQTPPKWGSINAGCWDLMAKVKLIKPKLHVFGHIHQGYGITEKHGTIFVNASSCTEDYEAKHKPIVVEILEDNHVE